jgi:hypothetical protein
LVVQAVVVALPITVLVYLVKDLPEEDTPLKAAAAAAQVEQVQTMVAQQLGHLVLFQAAALA